MKNNRLVILILILLVSYSCVDDNKIEIKKINKETFSNYETDIKLIETIASYAKETGRTNIINLDYSEKEDSVLFKISYSLNLFSLDYNPPVYYFETGENIVLIRSEVKGLKSYSGKTLELLMAKCFPSDYKVYKKSGEFPVPITFRCPEWNITCKNSKLIDK